MPSNETPQRIKDAITLSDQEVEYIASRMLENVEFDFQTQRKLAASSLRLLNYALAAAKVVEAAKRNLHRFYCEKCGYQGRQQDHPGCNYMGIPVGPLPEDEQALFDALADLERSRT